MKTLALALLVLAGLAGCASDAESYCENVGDCSQRGDTTWIQSCDDETSALGDEAEKDGCRPAFDAYFACTSAHFTCTGITSSFPGCDAARAALDACVAAAQAGSACAELEAATSSCRGASDAGAQSCDASTDCQARCYLDHVASPCAPRPEELAAVTTCASACP